MSHLMGHSCVQSRMREVQNFPRTFPQRQSLRAAAPPVTSRLMKNLVAAQGLKWCNDNRRYMPNILTYRTKRSIGVTETVELLRTLFALPCVPRRTIVLVQISGGRWWTISLNNDSRSCGHGTREWGHWSFRYRRCGTAATPPTLLEPRRRSERALPAVVQQA